VIFAFFFPHSLLAIENLLQNHFSFNFVILIPLSILWLPLQLKMEFGDFFFFSKNKSTNYFLNAKFSAIWKKKFRQQKNILSGWFRAIFGQIHG
jgi:hypothetical protein